MKIVADLLDVGLKSSKPHYPMALDCLLVLHDCRFEDVRWYYDELVKKRIVADFQRLWTEYAVK